MANRYRPLESSTVARTADVGATADLGLENVTAVKVEAACASSSAAVRLGHDLIHAQAQDAVLVVGVERMTGASREAVRRPSPPRISYTAGLSARAGGGASSAATLGHAPLEALNATTGVDQLLLARIERVAGRAHFDLQVMAQRRTGLEAVAASAVDVDLFVFGVAGFFHDELPFWAGMGNWARESSGETLLAQGQKGVRRGILAIDRTFQCPCTLEVPELN